MFCHVKIFFILTSEHQQINKTFSDMKNSIKTLRKEALSIPMNHVKRVDMHGYKYVERNEFGLYAYNDAITKTDRVSLK